MAHSVLPIIEGNQNLSQISDGHYSPCKNPIYDCYLATKHLGYRVFDVANNGICLTSCGALFVNLNLGQSVECNIDGAGGAMTIDVYKIMINK